MWKFFLFTKIHFISYFSQIQCHGVVGMIGEGWKKTNNSQVRFTTVKNSHYSVLYQTKVESLIRLTYTVFVQENNNLPKIKKIEQKTQHFKRLL